MRPSKQQLAPTQNPKRYIFYAVCIICLCAASVVWDSCKAAELATPKILFWLDQFAIWTVSTIVFYNVTHMHGPIRWLFVALAVLLIGLGLYLSHTWWDKKESKECHMAIHVLSALSVHCVILGFS